MTSLPSNLQQWLALIEASHPTEIDLGLERVAAVAQRLALTPAVPVVTVAGTNGKGSTVAYMRTVAAAHGLRVGCYTSPHFLHYRERVWLDGRCATDSELCEAFAAVEQARAEAAVSLTYFEYGTLAALWLFQRQPLDLWLLEVGLGGRLDAVNIIDSDVAVVTTVALDHEAWLGADREAIGREKAGIARSGRPLVYGETALPASVASHAESIGAPLLCWGREFAPTLEADGHWQWRGVDADGQALCLNGLPPLQLPFANASTALQALLLAGCALRPEAVRQGLAAATLTGRMQRLQVADRQLILDVAHNPHAAGYLAQQLPACEGQTWVVAAMLDDKAIEATLAALKPRVDHWRVAPLACPRAAPASRLVAALAGCDVRCSSSVGAALDDAIQHSGAADQILVMGSFYTVSAALEWLQE